MVFAHVVRVLLQQSSSPPPSSLVLLVLRLVRLPRPGPSSPCSATPALVVGDGGLVLLPFRMSKQTVLLLGGDGGVPQDQDGHHSSGCLQTKRERGVTSSSRRSRNFSRCPLPAQDGGLYSGAIGDGLIRIDVLAELRAPC